MKQYWRPVSSCGCEDGSSSTCRWSMSARHMDQHSTWIYSVSEWIYQEGIEKEIKVYQGGRGNWEQELSHPNALAFRCITRLQCIT
eukprot:scaffold218467_cov21-Tisochrysis_lutea.AAC.1